MNRAFLVFLCLTVEIPPQLSAQIDYLARYLKIHDVGNVLRVVQAGLYWANQHTGPSCEYPRGSGMDHVYPGDGFASELGLQRRFTDVGLLNTCEYYYAVTAFSKEDTVFGFRSRESRIPLSAVRAVPGTPPANRVGEVAVVPNPYRGDIAYNMFIPPWERSTGKWTTWFENDRRIQFINLPEQCEIKIFTLAGDLVRTLHPDDPSSSYHDWNLTSYVDQAVASGIHLFTMQDQRTGLVQVGKFVIIK